MLNLITSSYRPEYLDRVYASIPKRDDVRWIIIKNESFTLPQFERTPNITMANGLEGLENLHIKANLGISLCDPGLVQFLDEDTEFNDETYEMYQTYKEYYKLIIGKQVIWFEDKFVTRCESQIPECGKVDGGQALIHTDILKHIKLKPLNESPCADGNFLKECWDFCDHQSRILTNQVISKYNTLKL